MLNVKDFQSCSSEYFTCEPEKFCISLVEVCDFKNDCPNGYDELNCNQRITFKCSDGLEISPFLVCDHRQDCFDKSDEQFCSIEILKFL